MYTCIYIYIYTYIYGDAVGAQGSFYLYLANFGPDRSLFGKVV